MRQTPRPAPGAALALLLGLAGATPAAPSGYRGDCRTAQAREDIAAIAAATRAWYLDVVSAATGAPPTAIPLFAPICPDSPPVDLELVPPIPAADLAALLVPGYIAAFPRIDPWGHSYDFRLNLAAILSADVIAIRSAGADGIYEGSVYDVRWTSGPADDLVFYNDFWVRDLPRLDAVSRQRVSLEQVRQVGDALLSWITDVVSAIAPEGDDRVDIDRGPEVDMADYESIPVAELAVLLAPRPDFYYTRCVPSHDAWGTPYDYRLNDNVLGWHVAAIRSLGADGAAEGDVYPVATFPADERHHDLVWADGDMVREPDDSGLAIFFDGFESGELWGYWSCGPGF